MLIHTVCSALSKAKIPYAIVGGLAVALHGALRGTVDIDLVIDWTLKNLQKTEQILKEIGLVSLHPINADSVFHFRDEYIENRHMIAWNFYDPNNPAKQIDIIINYNLSNAHTKTIHTSEGSIKILSKEDLIKMKKASGRPQDLADIKSLEEL